MTIWSAEIKELETLYTAIKGRFPELEKELERLIKTDDENIVLIYSRRCLEVIITDLCECELKRPRKTEPLKGIIDKLHHEEKIPAHIITSMQNLNSLSTYGAHPKEFDPEQVKPVLSNLTIIIKWYLKYKDTQIISKPEAEEVKDETKAPDDSIEYIQKPKKKLILLLSGLALVVIIVVALFVFNIIGGDKRINELEKSIAVLPFDNLSSDEEQAWFSEGITDVIINQLSKISDLRVLSRTSTLKYKEEKKSISEIGEELGVNFLIEGTVQRQENQMMISVQLIQVINEDHLWSELYDREWQDIFITQKEIAQLIAAELKVVLSPDEAEQIDKQPTDNPEAYNLYLKGRYFWNKRTEDGIKEAIEYFNAAIEKDTNYALAYAGLADCHNMILSYEYGSSKDGMYNIFQKGKNAAIKALKIDSTLAEAYTSLAYVKLLYEWNWNGALKDLERAIQLNPDYGTAHQWYANCLTVFKRHDEAIAEAKRARELDPFSPIINRNVGRRLYFARQYDQAIEESLRALNINPYFFPTHWTLGLTYLQKGMFSEAILEMQKAVRYSEDNIYIQALLGYVYGATGNYSQAKAILNGLIETSNEVYVPSISYSIIYIGLGDNDNAFSWLEKAYEERSGDLIYLTTNPIYDPLRLDQRFIGLVKKMGFEE